MSEPTPKEKPALNLIQGIRDGSIDPSALSKSERQLCIETLFLEGYSAPQMSQLLECCEKTVKRDLSDIKIKNAQNPSPDFARQLVGNFLMKCEAHQARLMRFARSTEGPPGARIEAEVAAFQVLYKGMQLLQSLGYLPCRALQVEGNFIHHLSSEEDEASLEDIDKAIHEAVEIGETTKTLTPEIAERIVALKRRLETAKLSQEAQALLEHQKNSDQKREYPNEEQLK